MALMDLTASEVLDALSSKDLSATELADAVVNKAGKTDSLGALAAFDPDAYLATAKNSDQKRAKGEAGALEGIPLVLKDNIDTNDLPTTGGTGALAGKVPVKDAGVVTVLRREGAIIAAKAVGLYWGVNE